MTTHSHHTETQCCEAPGCTQDGLYRAPKSPQRLNDYHWFCLPHVRAYNLKWNFYANLTTDEIERLNAEDLGGRRPTWPLGQWASKGHQHIEDLKAALHRTFKINIGTQQRGTKLSREERTAAQLLELMPPFTPKQLKANYLKLVKKHHPDRHTQGPEAKKAAEEMFKKISAAYELLKKCSLDRDIHGFPPARE